MAGTAKGYPENNWQWSVNTEKHDEWKETCMNCALRHIHALRTGQRIDKETGAHHGVLAAWNLLSIFWYDDNEKGGKRV